MNDQVRADEDPALTVQLVVHLDRQPISGRLRTEAGAEERFQGWLGFVDALQRLHEGREPTGDPAGSWSAPRHAASPPIERS
jgi:hypothetical protein